MAGEQQMANQMNGFIKQRRSDEVLELARDPYAFTLLAVIAQRARRTNGFSVLGLKPGEALVGDYEAYGMTEQRYRTAKKHLAEWGLATFRATNKGTIARLANTRIYDINIDTGNDQSNDQLTTEQRSTNDQLTTNKKGRRQEDKNGREGRTPKPFIPPTVQEVADYATSRGCPNFNAQKFVDTYAVADWHDTKGNPVRNWKQKFISVWESDAKQAEPQQDDDIGTDPGAAEQLFEQIRLEKMAS